MTEHAPNFAERCAIIADLERTHAAHKRMMDETQARYELLQADLQRAMDLYINAITAPWRALAEELRR